MSPPSGRLDGFTPKYVVSKADGSPMSPGAKYLILRLDNKEGSAPEWIAARAYLDALAKADPELQELQRHLVSFFRPDLAQPTQTRFMRPNQLGEWDG